MSENQSLRQAALSYHEFPKPGKLEIRATKPLANGRDLSRAYSPGVAEACLEIKADQNAEVARHGRRVCRTAYARRRNGDREPRRLDR